MARAKTKGQGWFGESRRHSAAAKDGWKGRARIRTRTTTTTSPQLGPGNADVETIHAQRSKFSQQMDYKFNAQHTYSKFDPQGRALWAKAPNRNDIEGLDTVREKVEIELTPDSEKEKKPKKKPEEKEESHQQTEPTLEDSMFVGLKKQRNRPDVRIQGPEDVARFIRQKKDNDSEYTRILHLDTKNQIVGVQKISISTGSLHLTDSGELVKSAVLDNSAGVIIVHNHPSGRPEFSTTDRQVHRTLKGTFKTVGIDVLDTIVVGKEGYRSLISEGL
jgi:DNA repair protein RadC